ncbi:hypothetical protein KM295_00285 [Natronomonas sp. F2-12]|jgi:hypothetical protein|uniref:Uncharacterized protein n=1 Tax=Natronomonas aquatica TaxID=2841590 RepID=A0A9R1CNI4_9EURY|nr:hypothetical protein [Natronomonas aquatica]MCQ4331943.1 hypothetical protein [Natronomonas aquatica]
MARAVSTVLDVSVCLLLVGVAVTTLVFAVPGADERSDSERDTVAKSIGTVTASVPATDGRQTHDTLAGHLTAAAIVGASYDGERVGASTYPDAVRRTVRRDIPERTHITARWRPYPEASLRGQLTVGPEPPSTADVSVNRWEIDSGLREPRSDRSFEAIAASFATAYLRRLFPPERTRIALVDARTAQRTAARYRAVAGTLGVDIEDELADASSRRANERLADALTDRLESDLRESYGSPAEAESDWTGNNVELVVRRWEA